MTELMPTQDFGYNLSAITNVSVKAKTRTGITRILCLGDSITRGVYSSNETTQSWVAQLYSLITEAYGDAGIGCIAAREGSPLIGQPNAASGLNGQPKRVQFVTASTGLPFTGTRVLGGFCGEYIRHASGDEIRYMNVDCSKFTLLYMDCNGSNGGKCSVYVDGVAVQTNIGDNSVSSDTPRVLSFTVTPGTHTIGIRATSGNFNTAGIVVEKNFPSILLSRVGIEGWNANDWAINNPAASWQKAPQDLVILALGANDVEDYVAGTFKTHMGTIISGFQATGTPVLLYVTQPPGEGWGNWGSWPNFVAVMYELANQYDCALIDGYQAWFSNYEAAHVQGLYGIHPLDYSGGSGSDAIHPGDVGYRYIAQTVYRTLSNAMNCPIGETELSGNIGGCVIRSPSGVPFTLTVSDTGVLATAHRTLAYDLFDRADSVTSMGTANTGQTWTAYNGTWGIISNEAYNVSEQKSTNLAVAISDVGSANFFVSCKVKGDHTSNSNYYSPGITFHHINATDYLRVQLQYDGIWLYKRDNSTGTVVLASKNIPLMNGVYYKIGIRAGGNRISVFKDDVLIIDHTLSPELFAQFGSSRGVGFYLTILGSPSVKARWDNLIVEPL